MYSINIKDKTISIMNLKYEDINKLLEWYEDSAMYGHATGAYEAEKAQISLQRMIDSLEAEGSFMNGIYLNGKNTLIGMLKGNFNYENKPLVWINLLIIDKKYQRMGYGTAAANLFFRYLKEKLNISHILISVAECNEPALRFWSGIGFKKCKSIKGIRGPDTNENNAFIMLKTQ